MQSPLIRLATSTPPTNQGGLRAPAVRHSVPLFPRSRQRATQHPIGHPSVISRPISRLMAQTTSIRSAMSVVFRKSHRRVSQQRAGRQPDHNLTAWWLIRPATSIPLTAARTTCQRSRPMAVQRSPGVRAEHMSRPAPGPTTSRSIRPATSTPRTRPRTMCRRYRRKGYRQLTGLQPAAAATRPGSRLTQPATSTPLTTPQTR